MLKYNFESNSQRDVFEGAIYKVGNYMLKYNFESNSQRIVDYVYKSNCWELYAKVQFWKQFTT